MASVPVGRFTLEVPADMAWCFQDGSYYERNVAAWFERIARTLDGAAVYDVGANCGYYALLAAEAGAPVYAFEPVHTTFEALRRNLEQAEHAEALPFGLAGARGRREIHLYSSSGNNSLFERALPLGHPLVHTGTQSVELVSLDELAGERGLERPGLIKIDVEGAELDAIRGARAVIERHRPYLIVEYSETTARDAGYERAEIASELRQLGYDLYALSADERDETAYPLDAADLPAVDNLIAVPAGRTLPGAGAQPTLDLLIYSKDRPAQLELLLRSGERLFEEWDEIGLTVVFTHSAPEFARGYEIVRELHPEVRWVDEHETGETFKETTLRVLGGAEHTVFLVDDDVFKAPFSLGSDELRAYAADPEIACLSLRMCPRLDYCYALDTVTGVPAFERGTVWRWTEAQGDWGYPMSLDGHVFRTRELMPLLESLPFHHPNTLESVLAEHPFAAPKAICFPESRIVNIPANRVQDTHQNRHMGLATPEELNERFLAGERIALEPIEGVQNRAPHHETALEWEPGEHGAEPAPAPSRTVVLADDLLERPELLLTYADGLEPGHASELVIYAPDADPADAGARISALLAEHSVDDRELDMVLLAVPAAEGDRVVASLPTIAAPRPPATPSSFYSRFVSPGDLVFDVGANMGNRTETFLSLGANVVAVEPQAEATNHLRGRWPGEPRLTILECGLGDREGEAEMFVSNAHTLTSMAPDWIDAIQESGRFAEYRWDEKRVVPITTLATLIDTYGEPAFCKIDVEGFEEKVLAGLDRPLRACSLEFASEALAHLRRCVERLAELGPVECNYSLGESMTLAEPHWIAPGELLARLESLPGELPWGDVYVRSCVAATSSLSRERVVDHIGRQKVEGDYRNWGWYLDDLEAYQAMPGAPRIELADLNPQLNDKTPTNPYDGHYFFQDVWAARRVADARPARHVDVGSRVDYVGFLTALTEVTFVDIRPLDADVEGLTCIAGSILDMPFEDQSLESVSCLHVAEHIGLGRYGDPLDPLGTRKAAAELQRVVAPGGQLLFALPVGRARVCFNAHRVHSPRDVAAMFGELQLVELAGVDDTGTFRRHRTLDELEGAQYGCGMFRFVRR